MGLLSMYTFSHYYRSTTSAPELHGHTYTESTTVILLVIYVLQLQLYIQVLQFIFVLCHFPVYAKYYLLQRWACTTYIVHVTTVNAYIVLLRNSAEALWPVVQLGSSAREGLVTGVR